MEVSPWIALAVLGVGLVFVATGVASLVGSARRRRTWTTRPGTIVASRLSDGQFRFQVAFTDDDGREIRFWNRYTTSAGVDPVGRDVEVLVNPDDPGRAVVSRGGASGELTGAVLLAFGAVAVIVGVALAR